MPDNWLITAWWLTDNCQFWRPLKSVNSTVFWFQISGTPPFSPKIWKCQTSFCTFNCSVSYCNQIDDCLKWLFDEFLMTARWLLDEWRMTAGWLLDDCRMTARILPDDCQIIAEWLLDDCRMTARWLLDDCWLTQDDCQKISWWLPDDCQMTAGWLPIDCVS